MKFRIVQTIEHTRNGIRINHGFVVKKRTWYGWKPVTFASDYKAVRHYVDCKMPKVNDSKEID